MPKEQLIPDLPDFYPSAGNAFSHWLGRLGLRLFGWRVSGQFPPKHKMVFVVAPHTSNWDFFIGMFAKLALGVKIHWLAKHSIFVWPVGGLLKHLGGIPVKRDAAQGFAEQIAERYRQSETLFIAITPEGTRSKVEKLKTGFLRIAEEADVPILLIGFDYPSKQIVVADIFQPTGDLDKDEQAVRDYFYRFKGKRPELY